MADDRDQANTEAWQAALRVAVNDFAAALRQLHDSNPSSETPVVAEAVNMLATELWDRRFTVTEVTKAFLEAAAGLPGYTDGNEVRP
jgi:aminoglycoside phosphotransferase